MQAAAVAAHNSDATTTADVIDRNLVAGVTESGEGGNLAGNGDESDPVVLAQLADQLLAALEAD